MGISQVLKKYSVLIHWLQQIHQIYNTTAMLGVQLCLQFQGLLCNHNIAILFCCQNHVQGTSEGGEKQIYGKATCVCKEPN